MRFTRQLVAFDQADSAVEKLLLAEELDLLQLDYRWPAAWPADTANRQSRYAEGFLQQLRVLNRTFYLDPQLHVITNAGGGDVLGCVVAASEFFCEHDQRELLVTAVRGDNLLPQIESLASEGHPLVDIASGRAITDFQQPLLAAQVELGAGPLATALSEDARLVVAGNYDPAAPAIAAAAAAFDWSWQEYDRLATTAEAARLSASVQRADRPLIVEFTPRGEVVLTLRDGDVEQQLDECMKKHAPPVYADVVCHLDHAQFKPTAPGQLSLEGVRGSEPSGNWRVRITLAAGFRVSQSFEFSGTHANAAAQQLAQRLRELVEPLCSATTRIEVNALVEPGKERHCLVHAKCRSSERPSCEAAICAINSFLLRSNDHELNAAYSQPTIYLETEQLWAELPAEAITLSVDTRAAKEWI